MRRSSLNRSDTVMMIAREQRPGAKSYFNTRMWMNRGIVCRCF